jgi:hypothetical protein
MVPNGGFIMEKEIYEKIAKYTSIRGIDITGCETIEDLITTLEKEDSYYITQVFIYLNDEEKMKYCYKINRIYFLDYMKTLDKKTQKEVITMHIDNLKKDYIIDFIESLESDLEKYEYLELLSDKLKDNLLGIKNIILSMNDEQMKIISINAFLNDKSYYKIDTIQKLSDEAKELYIDSLEDSDAAKVILSFNNKELIKKYSLQKRFTKYRSKLVSATNDPTYIKEVFKSININKFRVNLITILEDTNLKRELTELLSDANLKSYLLSNEETILNNLITPVTASELGKTEVDNKITIGVELECCNKEIDNYTKTKTLLNHFDVKRDTTVRSGLEITSPIMHYDMENLTLLKSLCELLKENKFYTDTSCGGHIHIGSNYFTTKEDYLMLLYLYNNCEEILYYITDRENTKKRPSFDRYATKSKEAYIGAIDEGLFKKENFNKEITSIFNKINPDRYRGLNFKNIDSLTKQTIEFRMPNGEIDFTELLANIKLFSRLIEMSHKLNYLEKTDPIKVKAFLIGETKSDIEKLNLLLDILFTTESEKQIYIDRYTKNSKLDIEEKKKFLIDIKKHLFKEKEKLIISLEYDEEEKTLTKKVLN